MTRGRSRVAALLVLAALLPTAGCARLPDSARTAAPHPAPPVTTSPAPRSASDPQLARFDAIAREVIAHDPAAHGRAFVDALRAAGHPRSLLQVTPDRTTIGAAAPSVQFAVRVGDSCLIGQYGPARVYRGLRAPAVNGRCLIGRTRTIDW